MKHTIGKFVFAIMLTLGISAWCNGEEEPQPQTISIVFMHWWESEMANGALQMIVDGFETANSDNYYILDVELVNKSHQDVESVVHAGGFWAVPDVVGLDPKWIDVLVESDRLEPLGDCIEQEGIDVESLLGVRPISGEHWMLPLVSDIYVLYYNLDYGISLHSLRDMMDHAELAGSNQESPDQSLVQFNSTFSALTNYALILILSEYHPIISSDEIRMSPYAIESVLETVDLVRQAPQVLARSIGEFGNGDAAMMIESTRVIAWLTENYPDLDYGLAAAPIPSESGRRVSRMMLRWGIGIMRASENKDAACKFIAYLVDRQINASVASKALAIPVATGEGLACGSDNQLYCEGLEIFNGSVIHDGLSEGCDEKELELLFAERMRMMLDREMTLSEAAASIQWAWDREFSKCECP